MKRFFRLALCAVAAVAFSGVAQAQQSESYLLINAMLKANMGKLVDYKANLDSCRKGTLQEAGNLTYDYYQHCTDPSQILLFEKWKSEADLNKHMQMPHFVAMQKTSSEQGLADADFSGQMVRTIVDGQPKGERMLLNIVRKVKPEHVSTFRDSFLKCRVETLKEAGCEAYELYQSPTDPTIFFIFEIWKNEEAHKFHSSTPHLKTHSAETRGVADPEFRGEFVRAFIQ